MIVKAPNADFTGHVGADTFVDGVCEDASEKQVPYYRRHGYTVFTGDHVDQDLEDLEEDSSEDIDEEAPEGIELKRPAADAKKDELVEYATKALGLNVEGNTISQIWQKIDEHTQ